MGRSVIGAIVASLYELNVRVQFIRDADICRDKLIVPVVDLVGNLVADLHAAQFTGAFIRISFDLLRLFDVTVGQIGDLAGFILGDVRFITFNRRFCPAVIDLNTVVEDRQTGHDRRPVVIFRKIVLCLKCFSVHIGQLGDVNNRLLACLVSYLRIQGSNNLRRTSISSVVVIIPHLQDRQAEPFGIVGIGDFSRAVRRIDIELADGVTIRNDFDPAVGQFHTIFIRGQLGDLQRPLVFAFQRQFSLVRFGLFGLIVRSNLEACVFDVVCQQLQRDSLRTHLLLVLAVVPDLRDSRLGLVRFVRVGDLDGVAVLSVAAQDRLTGLVILAHIKLFDGVLDQRIHVGVNRQVLEGVGPFVAFAAQGDAVSFHAVCQQDNRDAARALGVVVAVVIPDLGDGDFSVNRFIFVDQGDDDVAVLHHGLAALGRTGSKQRVVEDQAFRVGLGHGVFAHRQFVNGVYAVLEVRVGDRLREHRLLSRFAAFFSRFNRLGRGARDHELQIIHIGVIRDASEVLDYRQAAQVLLIGVDQFDLRSIVLYDLRGISHLALFHHQGVIFNQTFRTGFRHRVQSDRQVFDQVAELSVDFFKVAVGEGLLIVQTLHGETQSLQGFLIHVVCAVEGLDDLQAAQVFLILVLKFNLGLVSGLQQFRLVIGGAFVHQEGVTRDQAFGVEFFDGIGTHGQVLDGVAAAVELAVEHLLHCLAVFIGDTEHQAAQHFLVHLVSAFKGLDDGQLAQVFFIGIGQVDVDRLVLFDCLCALGLAVSDNQRVVLNQALGVGFLDFVFAHRQIFDGVHTVIEVRIGDLLDLFARLVRDHELQIIHIGVIRDACEVLHDRQAAQVGLVGVDQFDLSDGVLFDLGAVRHHAFIHDQRVVRDQAFRAGLGNRVQSDRQVFDQVAELSVDFFKVAVGEGLLIVQTLHGETQSLQGFFIHVVRAVEGLDDLQAAAILLVGVGQFNLDGFVHHHGLDAVFRIGHGFDQRVMDRRQQLVRVLFHHGVIAHRQVLDGVLAVFKLRVEDGLFVIVRAGHGELEASQLDVSGRLVFAEVKVLDDLQAAQFVGVVVDDGRLRLIILGHADADLAVIRDGQAQALRSGVFHVLQARVVARRQVIPGLALARQELDPDLVFRGCAILVIVDVGILFGARSADDRDLEGLVLQLVGGGFRRDDRLGDCQLAHILGVLVVDLSAIQLKVFASAVIVQDVHFVLAGDLQGEAFDGRVVLVFFHGVDANRQVLPGDCLILLDGDPDLVAGHHAAVGPVVGAVFVADSDLPLRLFDLAADDLHGLLDVQFALVLVIGVGDGGFRRFFAFGQDFDFHALLIAVSDSQRVVVHLGAVLVFLDEVGARRQVVPDDLIVRLELDPLVVLGDSAAVGGVVGLDAFLILAVDRDAEGLAAVDRGTAIGHTDLLDNGQLTHILGELVLEEDLREVIFGEFSSDCQFFSVFVPGLGISIAAHLHSSAAPGVAFDHAALGLRFSYGVFAQRQVLQHQHAVAEVRVGEGGLFTGQLRPLAVDVAVLGGGFGIVNNVVGCTTDFGGHGEGQLLLLLVGQRHRASVEGERLVELEHAGLQGIGEAVAVRGGFIERRDFFRLDGLLHGIGDLNGVAVHQLVLRQILELVAPLTGGLVRFDGQLFDGLFPVIQGDRN